MAAVGRNWRKLRPRRAGPRRRKSLPSGSGWRTRNGSAWNGKAQKSPPRRRSPRSWATYEPEQKMASGMVVLSGRERQAPVQQALQRLCPSLQAEFPGGDVVLSALSFPPLPLGFELGEATACGGFFWGRLIISRAGLLPPIQGYKETILNSFYNKAGALPSV